MEIRLLTGYKAHHKPINWLSFAPNSRYFATASDDGEVALHYHYDDHRGFERFGERAHTYTGHSDAVTSVSLGTDILVSASTDCTARIHRVVQDRAHEHWRRSTALHTIRGHKCAVRCVDLNVDESRFVTASDDHSVKVWHTDTSHHNRLVASLDCSHTAPVGQARFSQVNTELVASAGYDGRICVTDLRAPNSVVSQLTLHMPHAHSEAHGLQWHPLAMYIVASFGSDGTVRLWDLRNERHSVQQYAVTDDVTSVHFHPSGGDLLASAVDQCFAVLDVFKGTYEMQHTTNHRGSINCIQFSPDGRHFATVGHDCSVQHWKWKSLRPNYDDLNDGGQLIPNEQFFDCIQSPRSHSKHDDEPPVEDWTEVKRHNCTEESDEDSEEDESDSQNSYELDEGEAALSDTEDSLELHRRRLNSVSKEQFWNEQFPLLNNTSEDTSELYSTFQRFLVLIQQSTDFINYVDSRLRTVEEALGLI